MRMFYTHYVSIKFQVCHETLEYIKLQVVVCFKHCVILLRFQPIASKKQVLIWRFGLEDLQLLFVIKLKFLSEIQEQYEDIAQHKKLDLKDDFIHARRLPGRLSKSK